MDRKKDLRWPRWLGIFTLLLAWLIWPACMSFQRDGWDPKWGEEEADGDKFKDEDAPPKAQPKAKDPNAEVEKAMEQVDSELAADANKPKEAPPPQPQDDLGIVAIPPPIEGMPPPEVIPDPGAGSGELKPEEPPAVEKPKKKEDGSSEEESEE